MRLVLPLAALFLAVPAVAQMPAAPPGKQDRSAVKAGTYKVDPNHTQVVWQVNHMGFSMLEGMFGASEGTLTLDPARPQASKLSVTFPIDQLSVTSDRFAEHLKSPDFFNAAQFPEGRFESTAVRVNGNQATITGNLTLKGVTKPVTLQARFVGAGVNPMNKKTNFGFRATGQIKRSDFGLGMAAPVVSDTVDLSINAAFEEA